MARAIKEIELIKIKQSKRERKDLGDIDGLATSMTRRGLFHPILVSALEDGNFELLAGQRRLAAAARIDWKKISCHVIASESELSEDEKKEVELEENIRRKEFTWQELLLAKLNLLEIKQRLYGIAKPGYGGGWGLQELATYLGESLGKVSQDIELAKALKEVPDLGEEKNKSTAWKVHKNAEQTAVVKELTKRVKENPKPTIATLVNGDSIQELKKLEDNSVDFVLTDPPFGKDLVMRTQDGVVKPYEDDEFDVFNTIELVLRECYRILKDDRVLLMFCDIGKYEKAYEACKSAEFSVYRAPLLWCKPSGGNIPDDSYYGLSYECIMHCQKGKRSLNNPGQRNWIECDRVPASSKIHPTQKPPRLLRYLIEQHSHPGELVVDPFAGSASTLEVATQLGRKAWGCEILEEYFTKATLAMSLNVGDKKPYEGLTPGGTDWMKIWNARPELQKEMVEYRKKEEDISVV